MPKRARLDAELVRRGLARSREQASALIAEGKVTVRGMVATKPATGVESGAPIVVRDSDDPGWASRGAHKLLGALEAFTPQGLSTEENAVSTRAPRPVASPTSCCATAPPR